MTYCKTGKHYWNNEVSAKRCCNGWHRELRIGGAKPDDDKEGRVYVDSLNGPAPRACFVWVRDTKLEGISIH